jgi:hypothetical protein
MSLCVDACACRKCVSPKHGVRFWRLIMSFACALYCSRCVSPLHEGLTSVADQVVARSCSRCVSPNTRDLISVADGMFVHAPSRSQKVRNFRYKEGLMSVADDVFAHVRHRARRECVSISSRDPFPLLTQSLCACVCARRGCVFPSHASLISSLTMLLRTHVYACRRCVFLSHRSLIFVADGMFVLACSYSQKVRHSVSRGLMSVADDVFAGSAYLPYQRSRFRC